MTRISENPAHWRERAEEARNVADEMKDPECKRTMLDIAQSYEYLAAAAQKRLDQSK